MSLLTQYQLFTYKGLRYNISLLKTLCNDYIYIYCQYCIIYLNIKLKISYSLLVFNPTYLQALRSILPFCSLNYHLYDMNLLNSFNKISFNFGKLWQFLVTSKVVAFTKMLHSEISQIRTFDPWLIAVAMALNTTIIT